MPSSSAKQHRFMEAVAHNPAFAKKAGIPQSVGKDFSAADKGRKFSGGGRAALQKINKQNTQHGAMDMPFKSLKKFTGMKSGGKVRRFDEGGLSAAQEKWLGGADRTDDVIMARMRKAVPDRAPVEDRTVFTPGTKTPEHYDADFPLPADAPAAANSNSNTPKHYDADFPLPAAAPAAAPAAVSRPATASAAASRPYGRSAEDPRRLDRQSGKGDSGRSAEDPRRLDRQSGKGDSGRSAEDPRRLDRQAVTGRVDKISKNMASPEQKEVNSDRFIDTVNTTVATAIPVGRAIKGISKILSAGDKGATQAMEKAAAGTQRQVGPVRRNMERVKEREADAVAKRKEVERDRAYDDMRSSDMEAKYRKGGFMKKSMGMPSAAAAEMMARRLGAKPRPMAPGMKKGGMPMKDGKPAFMMGKKMNMGGMAKYAKGGGIESRGKTKGTVIRMASGGSVSSASRRADGIAQRGKTRG